MIDLSFLTEAEQEAILKVLNRDAELKKAEDERVKQLQDVVDDENEYKYKSGQWFYDAKSKRHRDKIHGAELVRASIRKRKKPATIAELSKLSQDSSKRRWVNSVNQDIFIPPELYGVMEAPDEAEEDIKLTKQEGNQSSKKVSFSSPEKEPDKLRNGTLPPPKPRQNPFNSGGLQDEADFNNEASSLNPDNIQMNGTEKPKTDIMSSLAKYGVRLPYPEPPKSTVDSPKSHKGNNSPKQVAQVPVPKPRTLRMNGQPQDRSNSLLKKDESFNDMGKPRGILKRRSSSSSTDSESIRIAQGVEPNKIVLAGSPILEAGQNNFFDEQDASDNSLDRFKQVRFSEKIHQKPPSPNPETFHNREAGEYGILDPGLSVALDHGFEDQTDSEEDSLLDQDPYPIPSLTKVLEQNAALENQGDSMINQPLSLETERNRVTPKEDFNKRNDSLSLEASTDMIIEPPSNNSSGEEPLYAVVDKKSPAAVVDKKSPAAVVDKKTPAAVVDKKTPAASSPSQSQQPDFDLDDALGEPGLHGQRGKTQNIYLNEKPLEFGKSFSGGGKITFESSDPNKPHKESYNFSSEELTPEKARNTETSYSNVRPNPVAIAQDDVEPVELWRRPLYEKQEPRRSSDFTKDQKTSINTLQESPGVDVKAEDTFGKNYPENQPSPAPGEYSKGTKYKSLFLQNRYDAEHKPVGLTTNLPVVQNVSEPSKSGQLDKSLLHENKERQDLPRLTHFNVMSLKERINEMPREQMSNPSQFQSLKHFWNVEEKNLLRGTTVTSPDKILTNVSSRSKPIKTDVKQRSSEIPADEVIFPNTLDNLSEEEQTSQKVASWLAQTPTVYVGQMDQNEDLLHSGEEIAEHVQKATIHKKSDEEFANALQKLREEASEAPKITERSRTEEVQMVPQGKPELVDRMQTTKTISPTSQNSIDTKAPATNFETTDRAFHERVVQRSNKMDQKEDPLYSKKEIAEHVQKSTIPKKSDEEFANALQKLREEASEVPRITERSRTEEVQMVPQGKPELVNRMQTTVTISPTSQNSKDAKAPATDFETTDRAFHERVVQISNKRSPAKETLSVEAKNKPFEEDIDDAVAPEKSASEFSISFEKLEDGISNKVVQKDESSLPNEASENEPVEVIERSAVPKSQDQQDFISSLKKLEIEASKPPLPDVEAEYRDGLPEEEMRQNTVSPVKSSLKIGFEQFGTPADDSVDSQPQHSYVTSREPDTEKTSDMKETIEKSTVPSRKDNEDLSIALRKLELEAIEPQSDEEYDVGINQEVEFEKPKSQLALQTNLSEDDSDTNLYSYPDGKTVDDLDQPPEVSSYGLTPNTFEGPGKLPVAEEEPIDRTKMDSQSAGDFHKRLMQLEEQAKIPEEPEDSLVDEAAQVSQFPNREVEISKKVYSSIESMPTSIENSSKNGKAKGVDSPRSKPKDDLKSHGYSPYKELANYPQSPEPSGSYTGFENMLYKKPEVGSPEVSNSKPGMDESHPILSALKRSEAKMLNSKAVQEVSPTSTNQLNSSNPTEDAPAPTVNSFPQNPETLKRLSQSVPSFLQDEVSGSVMSIYSGDFGNVDIKGGIEFSVEYVEQLKEFLIYIYQCRDLAVAEVKKQRSDPYVKAYLLPEKAKMGKRKTAVKKKTLNPVYNEILRYKIPKPSLLAQTLNLSVWHHDALGRNSFLGEVTLKLGVWDWSNTQRTWYQLEPRTPAAGMGLENRGEMKLSVKYVPLSPSGPGTKPNMTGEVYIWIRECLQLPMLRENKINSFVKCTVLPDTSRKSRQKTRTVDKTPSPIFNHTMVYDGFKEEDLREACVELTVWDHNRLSNHFLGGLRIGLGTGKSYGTAVDWMDSTHEETIMWEKMMASPNIWVEGMLPLRMFKMAKLTK